MARAEMIEVRLRIIIEQPVPGVWHSLQTGSDGVLDPQRSSGADPLTFDFNVGVAPGPKFSGDQVRREGPVRRFVYIRIGQLAGDAASPWTRRMKIDIHNIDQQLLDRAVSEGGVIETVISGTGRDGSPACATVAPIRRGLVSA